MNKCKYKIDTEHLESIRLEEGLPMAIFKNRFITKRGKPIAYTTYHYLIKKGICSARTMLAIKSIYPEVIGFLPINKS